MGIIKTYHELMNIIGMGKHVKRTVMRRKGFLPNMSLEYPIGGLIMNDKNP